MFLKSRRSTVAIAFVVGETWLTTAEVLLAARQSTQVSMLCQRPIHTHSSMSAAQLISSHLLSRTAKITKFLFRPPPAVLIQWPERLYQQLTLQRPQGLKLTGHWAEALLAEAGFSCAEWRWDMQLTKQHCRFLLMKLTDYHEHSQALLKHQCTPQVVSFTPKPKRVLLNTQHVGAWPDVAATQQAIYLANRYLTGQP